MSRSAQFKGLAVGVAIGVGASLGVLALTDGDGSAPPKAPLDLPLAQPRDADDIRLVAYEDCDDLLAEYRNRALPKVGPYGWRDGFGYWGLQRDLARGSLDTATGIVEAKSRYNSTLADPLGSSATGTNTQEQGVDEPDLAKTDGDLVVQLQRGRTILVTDVTGPEPRRESEVRLPREVMGQGLLLAGDHLIVVSTAQGDGGPIPLGALVDSRIMPQPYGYQETRVLDYDLSDPSKPDLVGDRSVFGSVLDLRQYGTSTIRIGLTTARPEFEWVTPDRKSGITTKVATDRNKALVRESTIEDWLPKIVNNEDGESAPLLECGDVSSPGTTRGVSTLALIGYNVESPEELDATAVIAEPGVVYSNAERFLFTAADFNKPALTNENDGAASTQVHAFDLEGIEATYVGSARVAGILRDRWSLDAYDGTVRLAVQLNGRGRGKVRNAVIVLGEPRDQILEEIGRIDDLGVGEDIQSVRWFQRIALVVTFRQIDPLYVLDLVDPSNPRKLGELKIPGFSSYLHPIGERQILGLGTDATLEGRSLGPQVATFDLSRLRAPRQAAKLTFPEQTYLPVSNDPHLFNYLPEQRVALTILEDYRGKFTGYRPIAISIAADGSLTSKDLPNPGGYEQRMLPLGEGRVALVGKRVELVNLS